MRMGRKECGIVLFCILLSLSGCVKAPRGLTTPFQYLCNHYETSEKDVKIELMVQYGADINSVTLPIPVWFRKVSEEKKACVFRYVSFLWENGVSDGMHVGTQWERTVLHSAAECLDAAYLSRLCHNEKREMAYLLNERDSKGGDAPLFCSARECTRKLRVSYK